MARALRTFVPGVSVHLMQRGINRMVVFHDAADNMSFLATLRHSAVHHGVEAHAYVLMGNHFHLLATPPDPTAIPRMMKEVGLRYAQYYNRRYVRIGTVWNGRYRAKIVGDERYWLTCLRYVEQNPVRAKLVTDAAEYRWSSYIAHRWGHWPDWLTPHPVFLALGRTAEQRQVAYQNLCDSALKDDELALVRCSLPTGLTPNLPSESLSTVVNTSAAGVGS